MTEAVTGRDEPFQPPLDDDDMPDMEEGLLGSAEHPARPPEEEEGLAKAIELNQVVLDCEAEYRLAAEDAEAKKKAMEAAQAKLNRYLASLKEEHPLFDKASPTLDIPAPDGWEGVQLATIEGFPPKVLAALDEDLGIFALGSLEAWTAAGGKLTDLDGVGPAKAEAAEKALEGFWAEWNEKYPAEEKDSGTEAD